MSPPQNPQAELPLHLPNLATVMKAVGYSTPYKGKFHITKTHAPNGQWRPEDVEKYGFERWNPPDAGANQDPSEFGGGDADNDGRFMHDDGTVIGGNEGVLAYLRSDAPRRGPFFLVVSLVNPHDVLAYPNTAMQNGYNPTWLEGNIKLPATVDEDLSTKPAVQREFLALLNKGMGRLDKVQQRNYINFYGNLIKASDDYLVQVLDTLEREGLLENTLIIRTADHGELGMAHGGLRQKNFNFYEEALRIPLIYSNPRLYKRPYVSDAIVSHVDLLPTLAALFHAPASARAEWQGIDYSEIVLDPRARAKQKYTVFTYDDFQSGQPNGPYPGPLNHIVSIREERYKLAKYYDAKRSGGPYEWELYDLENDPLETRNLGHRGHQRNRKQQAAYERLRKQLAVVERTRLQLLPKPKAKAKKVG
jgi:arylsulfatase A-like enzyme